MSAHGLTGDLIIPNKVKSIGNSPFFNCSGFTGTLVIPESVTTCHEYAFRSMNTQLERLEINMHNIIDRLFPGPGGTTFKEIIIGDKVERIGQEAFIAQTITEDLIIPESVSEIGKYAFTQCRQASNRLVIPNSVCNVGENAFINFGVDGHLTSIEIDLTNIPDYFMTMSIMKDNWTAKTRIILGQNVKTIGKYAFNQCEGITGSLIIPEGVTSVGEGAFNHCININEKLSIPNSLDQIGGGAFSDIGSVNRLNEVYIDLTTIPSELFKDSKIGILEFGNNVKYINQRAFSGCKELYYIRKMSENLEAISEEAFSECNNLSGNLIIPSSVFSIGRRAFYNCTSLSNTLVIPNAALGEEAFKNALNNIEELYINTNVPSGFCYGSSKLKKLVIGDNVSSIDGGAFSNCTALNNLVIGKNVSSIGGSAFAVCTSLTGDLEIGANVSTISGGAFYGCSGLNGNLIFKGTTKLESGCFSGCNNIIRIKMPYVQSIGGGCFQRMYKYTGCGIF